MTADVQAFDEKLWRIWAGAVVLIRNRLGIAIGRIARVHERQETVKHFPGCQTEEPRFSRATGASPVRYRHAEHRYGPSTGFEAHHVSMPLNVYHIENDHTCWTCRRQAVQVNRGAH
jgi:hypothetical protein